MQNNRRGFDIRKGIFRFSSYLFVFIGFLFILKNQPAYALTEDEKTNINIYESAGPSVVNINTTTVTYDFFYNALPATGAGSGIIVDKKGNIITNYHVIENAKAIDVTLFDGSKYGAEAIGIDPASDLAVIRIKAPQNKLKPIAFGDSSALVVGQKVLAIGSPFGLEKTLTVGVVSSLGRTLRAGNNRLIRGVVQTDAAINPGNSGGPLLNSQGEMIGINTAIFSPAGGSIGIGFAVPVNAIKRVLPELLEKGYVRRPWLGIAGQSIDESDLEAIGLESAGVLIAEVYEAGPAKEAGLRGATGSLRLGNLIVAVGGDLITAIDGKDIKTMEDLDEFMENAKIGHAARVRFLRDGKRMTLSVRLTEMLR